MARNRIQFQKGLSEARFQALYGDEERCRALVIDWRWPDGFICPKCRGRACCVVGSRRLFQGNACRKQTSQIAGTIFHSTKLPLTVWFRAMYLITQTKQGISSIELGRRLGTTQTTAWKIKTKLAEVMRLDNDRTPLDGRVEMDDAYLGGKRSGGKTGRGSPGKRPIVVALQSSDGKRPAAPQGPPHRALQEEAHKVTSQAHHCAGRVRRDRWACVLPGRGRCGRRATYNRHGRQPPRRRTSLVPLAQYRPRQHQDGDRRHLQGGAQEASGTHARRV